MQTYRILLQTFTFNCGRYRTKTEVQFIDANSLIEARDTAISKSKLKGITPIKMSMGWIVWS